MNRIPGMATEELCPECGRDFLVRKVDDSLQCPDCGYEETAEDNGG